MNTIQCLGIIPDGNRRWAKQRNIPLVEGYRDGLEKVREVLEWVKKEKIAHVILYGLSGENMERDPSVLDDVFSVILRSQYESSLNAAGVSFRVIGDMSRMPERIVAKLHEVEEKTKQNCEVILWALISYSGRADILNAVKQLGEKGGTGVTEEMFKDALRSAPVPDPDVIIRTGGMKRLSNFLPWQSVYSELFFLETLWPDFSEKEFKAAVASYRNTPINRGK